MEIIVGTILPLEVLKPMRGDCFVTLTDYHVIPYELLTQCNLFIVRMLFFLFSDCTESHTGVEFNPDLCDSPADASTFFRQKLIRI